MHRESPKTTRDNFWPRIVYAVYNFYGDTTTIKGSFILKHADVIFSAKKLGPVKIGPQNGGLTEI